MGDRLPSPPLVEAVCEFRFVPHSEWDWTIPGRLYDKICSEFSEKTQVNTLRVQASINDPKMPPVVISGPERIQIKRPDGSAMVQVGPYLLTINHLRPYPDWETFRDLIIRVLEDYIGLDDADKPKLARIGLRYINQIPMPEGDCALGNFITLEPPLKGVLDKPLAAFYQKYELLYESLKGVLIHQTGIQRKGSKNLIMLDLDFGSSDPDIPAGSQGIETWLNRAHDIVLESFVGSLNASYYERLKRGEI